MGEPLKGIRVRVKGPAKDAPAPTTHVIRGRVMGVHSHHSGKDRVSLEIRHGRVTKPDGIEGKGTGGKGGKVVVPGGYGFDDRPTSNLVVPPEVAARFPHGSHINVSLTPGQNPIQNMGLSPASQADGADDEDGDEY